MQEYEYLGKKAYLDWCSVGLQPQRTLDFCRGFQQEFVDTMGQVCFGPYGERREQVRSRIAELIHCDPEEVLWTRNTTEGDCLLMHGLDYHPGDGVIVSRFDYPALTAGWYKKREQGLIVKEVPAVNGAVRAEDFIALMDETTRVAAVSWVQFMSGYRADLKKIGQECRKRGILFVVDGIQAMGRLQIDVQDCCIDVLSSGSFKGMLGAFGAGFVYIRKELISRLRPWQWTEETLCFDENEFRLGSVPEALEYRPGIRKLECGSQNTYGILTMGKSLELLQEIGMDVIEEHVLNLEKLFRRELAEQKLPLHLLGAEEETNMSGMVCINFDSSYLEALQKELKEQEVYVTVRKMQGQGFLRFTIHVFNTEEHIRRLRNVLQKVFGEK